MAAKVYFLQLVNYTFLFIARFLSANIRPVNLPSLGNIPGANVTVTVSGWGRISDRKLLIIIINCTSQI